MPSDGDDPPEVVGAHEDALHAIPRPVTDKEAAALLGVFHPDGSTSFGLAETLVVLIETAPGWPDYDALARHRGEYIDYLRARAATT